MKKIFAMFFILFLTIGLIYGQSSNLNKPRDRANDSMDKMSGLIPMRFFNAIDRNPIPNATVLIQNVGTFVTDKEGKIAFPIIPDGEYKLTFIKEGFIDTEISFKVLLSGVDLNWYAISPGFSNREYRIVLEWGERPADLDINLTKAGGSGNYHISYRYMRSAEDGNTVLDRDDVSGYGPETITIGRIDLNSVYTCFVHDYTNRNNTASTELSQRGAVVRVYSRDKVLYTFRVPANRAGTKWEVFKIENGVFIPINAVNAR